MDQSNLLENMVEFNGKSRPKQKKVRIKRRDIYGSVNALFDGWESNLNAFKSGIFPIKTSQGKMCSKYYVLNKSFKD